MNDDVRKMAEEILACVYSPVSPFVVDRLEARLRAALDQAREEGRRAEGVSLCHFNEVATALDSAEGERDFLARRVEELERIGTELIHRRGEAEEERDALLALGRAVYAFRRHEGYKPRYGFPGIEQIHKAIDALPARLRERLEEDHG